MFEINQGNDDANNETMSLTIQSESLAKFSVHEDFSTR